MKARDAMDYFTFTDASMIIDSEDNVIGCDSEFGLMECAKCQFAGCKCYPEEQET